MTRILHYRISSRLRVMVILNKKELAFYVIFPRKANAGSFSNKGKCSIWLHLFVHRIIKANGDGMSNCREEQLCVTLERTRSMGQLYMEAILSRWFRTFESVDSTCLKFKLIKRLCCLYLRVSQVKMHGWFILGKVLIILHSLTVSQTYV